MSPAQYNQNLLETTNIDKASPTACDNRKDFIYEYVRIEKKAII